MLEASFHKWYENRQIKTANLLAQSERDREKVRERQREGERGREGERERGRGV